MRLRVCAGVHPCLSTLDLFVRMRALTQARYPFFAGDSSISFRNEVGFVMNASPFTLPCTCHQRSSAFDECHVHSVDALTAPTPARINGVHTGRGASMDEHEVEAEAADELAAIGLAKAGPEPARARPHTHLSSTLPLPLTVRPSAAPVTQAGESDMLKSVKLTPAFTTQRLSTESRPLHASRLYQLSRWDKHQLQHERQQRIDAEQPSVLLREAGSTFKVCSLLRVCFVPVSVAPACCLCSPKLLC
jgi:hypothetical protein